MLSPATWHEQVPRQRQANLRFRLKLLRLARASRSRQRALREACSTDLLFYVNAFCWTFDPRTKEKFLPFVTWPVQDRAFRAILDSIEKGADLVIEKSRDMGASWMSLTAMEWLWHFHRGQSFLMVSRKEGLVDAPGDPDSLFWKVDFIHRHLPDWLRPDIERRKLHFGNLDNGSTIDGESTTAAAGVGGRRTAMFIDEFSRIEEGYQLLAGTADTTNCRIFNFTPWGTSNAAYKLARRADVARLRLHWSEHPEKARGLYRFDRDKGRVVSLDRASPPPLDYPFIMDGKLRSPWYDAECTRRASEREVAQMLDIDYQGSAYQFFERYLIVTLQETYASPPTWEGDIAADSDTGRPLDLVRCKGGPLKLWCPLDTNNRPPLALYAAGGDISTGNGATNSCLSLANAQTGEKVLEYATPFLKAEQFALRATAICWLFRDGKGETTLLGWEHQGPGLQFGARVLDLGYRNILHREVNAVVPQGKVSDAPGWFPSNENKRLLLEEYRAALATRQFVNRSFEALDECLAFVHTSKGVVEHSLAERGSEHGEPDPTGARANHGDRVIADAICWKLIKSLGMVGNSKKREPDSATPGSLAWRRGLALAQKGDDGW